MTKEDAQQGVLMGLEAPDHLRHPMWVAPDDGERLPPAVRALRVAIAKSLIPIDGREEFAVVTMFAEAVYADSRMSEFATNTFWLMGKVMYRRAEWARRINGILSTCQPVNQPIYRQERALIERLGVEWAQAIADEVLS